MNLIRFACRFFSSFFRHVYHRFLIKWLVWIVGFNRNGAKGSRFNAIMRPFWKPAHAINKQRFFHKCENDHYQMKRSWYFLFLFCLKHKLWAHVRVLTRTHNLWFRAKIRKMYILYVNRQCQVHLSRNMRKPTMWFLTRSDTNQAIQLLEIARVLKFCI